MGIEYKTPEKWRQTNREYKKRNAERCNKLHREWKKRNPEKVSLSNRKYREENMEYYRQYQKEYMNQIENRERRNIIERERIRNDPQFHLNCNMASAIWFALKQNKAGRRWETLIGYTLIDLMRHLESLFTPEMSWENYGSYWWIDHKKPRSLFNFKTAEDKEFQECWSLENLQPLEKIANIRKSNNY